MAAVHRIPEIVDIIFQHLRFTEDLATPPVITAPFLSRWRKRRSSLLNAGLACKAFFQPAMANLWWRVDGIMPLIKLLPNISMKVSQSSYDYFTGREWSLEEELDEQGMERFDFYAKLVTHILDMGRKGEDSFSVLLIQLAEIRSSSRCFPRLKSFRAVYFNPDPWLFYTAPTLQELTILAQNYVEDPRLRTSLSTLIGRLPARSPNLQVVQIPFVPHERSLKALLQLQDLRNLTIKYTFQPASLGAPPISEIVGELSALPRLEKLDLYCPPTMLEQPPLIPPAERTSEWYPQLTSLAVTGNIQSVQSVLFYLNSKPLEEINLRLYWQEPRDPSDASQDVAALTMTVQTLAESLKSVSISCEPSSVMYPIASFRSVPLSAEFIAHLLGLPHLEVLQLAPSLSVPTLTDAFLPSIAQSWPKLRKLSLPQTLLSLPISQRASALTFGAVQKMVRGLPDLAELSLEFSACDSPLPDLVAPQLRVLNVRASPISNRRRTALNLARAFPSLEKLSYTSITESQNASTRLFSEAWKEVATWLPVLTGRYGGEEDDGETVVTVRGPRTFGEIIASHPVITYEEDLEDDYEFEDDSDDPLGYGGDDF